MEMVVFNTEKDLGKENFILEDLKMKVNLK